ncbi:hypothetical protein NP233_g6682 [Leucocoprinus birnbaumii]|uniref:Uncharacterized protein n=1 Tax=Leucocoprinus birnbaumii TaxID=56174 RepID=A0AAD5YVB2_9AGAR|nr:hypothetical protein NP233_g6682 [Leucocoprinus birnbaumii]
MKASPQKASKAKSKVKVTPKSKLKAGLQKSSKPRPDRSPQQPKRDRSKKGPDGLTKDERHNRFHRKKPKKGDKSTSASMGSKKTPSGGSSLSHQELQYPPPATPNLAIPIPSYHIGNDFSECETARFSILYAQVVQWVSNWGGLENWPIALQKQYEEAVVAGPVETDRWYDDIWNYADEGRMLRAYFAELHGSLPTAHSRVKELYRREIEAMASLVRGITIIETRVPLYGDSDIAVRAKIRREVGELPCSDPPSDSSDY